MVKELYWTKILLVREKGKQIRILAEKVKLVGYFFNASVTFLFSPLLSMSIGHIVDKTFRPKVVITCILFSRKVLENELGTRAPQSLAPCYLGAAA